MYVLDTNILVLAVRKAEIWQRVQTTLSLNSSNMLISIVSQGELYSLADQFGWGNSKQEQISHILSQVHIIPIQSEALVQAYRDIDTFSQAKHRTLKNEVGFSSRNMGKNDLWISATTLVTGASLVTTDADFLHLHNVFFDVIFVKP
jgi:tRNA(fMet)-specific endonuclease VapC